MHELVWVASGLLAGVAARIVMRGRSRGFFADTVLGALGSVTGSWLLRLVQGEVPPGALPHLSVAFIGALVVVGAGRVARDFVRNASQLAPERATTGLADLEGQIQRLTQFERMVLNRVIGRQGLRDPAETFEQQLTFGQRVADQVASFGGSWTFLGCFAAFMLAWMFINTQSSQPSDPYPFILLNLVLSCLAAVQAPVIMMSQNRHSSKDRFDAQQDYQVNLRAEMQILALHAKLDEARATDWQTMIALQREQVEALRRLEQRLDSSQGS